MAEVTVKRLQVVNQQGDIFTLDPVAGTEYEDATQQKHGLMSTSDKTKLDGIASSANVANIQYDSDYNKITKTINGTSSDVVSAATLKTAMQLNNVNNTSDADKPISDATQNALDGKINNNLIGVAGGVAELDLSGKVPSSQLPSYVDDVLEYNSIGDFPLTGETGKIYVAIDTNKSYRWSGSTYIELSSYALATQSAAGLMSATDKTKLDGIMTAIASALYPVGSIYTSVVSTSPSTLFGIGTWEQIKGKFLYACEDSGITAGTTGGAKSVSYTPAGTVGGHTLTTSEIPSHSHTFTGSAVTSGWQSQGHTHTFTTGNQSADHAHGGWSGGVSANHVHSGPSHSHGVGSYATGDKGAHDHYMNYVMANYWEGGNVIALGNGSSSMRYYSNSGTRPITAAVGDHNHTISGISAADGTGNTGYISSDHTHYTTTGGVSANHTHSGTTDGVNQGHTHSVTAEGTISSTGGGESHNHGFTGTAATIATMPPYLAVYMWKRTA